MVEFAFGTNRAIVRQHDMLRDRESQPGATRFPGSSFVYAVEALEQSRQVLIRNAGTEVADIKFNSTFRPPRAQHQPAAGCRIFERIVDKVRENLVDSLTISVDQIRRRVFHLQVDAMSTRQFTEILHRFLQNLSRRNRLNIKTLLARFHSRQGEKIFREARHAMSILADNFEKL